MNTVAQLMQLVFKTNNIHICSYWTKVTCKDSKFFLIIFPPINKQPVNQTFHYSGWTAIKDTTGCYS